MQILGDEWLLVAVIIPLGVIKPMAQQGDIIKSAEVKYMETHLLI